MEIRQLHTFKAVVDYRSFHKAANAIHYAQSTVSAQIMALEEELGVQLFERLGRSIVLTEVGESMYQYACKMLELADAARAELAEKTHLTGSLTIRVPESFCAYHLPPVIARFHKRMPNVKLRFITCAQEELDRDLRKGVTDLAFLLAESIQSKDLTAEVLGIERLVFIAAPGHPLAQLHEFRIEMIAEHTLLLSQIDCSYRRLFEQMLQDLRCEPKMVLEFNSLAAIISNVMAGLGVTLIPEVAVSTQVKSKKLVVLPWNENELEVAQLMIWHHDKWITPVLEGFMNATREILKIA
jgi:DNA-binding transcriptional LysR family regulator